MTAAPSRPPAVPRVSCAACLERVEAAHAAHTDLHARWKLHANGCLSCSNGLPCRIGDRYAAVADDAGKRWEMAEAEAARQARAVAV